MSPAKSKKSTKASLEKELQETKKIITSIKSMGAEVESAEIIAAQAQKALENDNLDMTRALIDSADNTLTLIRKQYFVQAASILFSSLQRSIVSLEGAGTEVSYVKDLYNKAKERFEAGQYEEAMDYVKSAEEKVHDLNPELPVETIPGSTNGEVAAEAEVTYEYEGSQEQMEKVSLVLINVEKLLQEAMDAGYAVDEAEKLYSLAEDAFDYQDYKKAEEYAMQSKSNLEETLEPMRTKDQEPKKDELAAEPIEDRTKSREDLPTGDRFTYGASMYSDIMPKGIIGDAPKKGEKGEITTIEELKTVEEAQDNLELKIEKQATNLLITADEKINAAKETGLNIPMAERLLTIGESYFDRGEFDRVKEYAEKAILQVDDIVARKGYTAQIEAKLTKTEVEAGGVPEEGPEEGPEQELGDETISESKLAPDEAPEEDEQEEEMESISPKELKDELIQIKYEINETKEMGISVENAGELLKKAVSQFKASNYSESSKIGSEARKKIKNIKKKFIKKKALEMIKYAWQEIESAENQGVDIAVANSLLQESRNLVKAGEFKKAVELAMKSIQVVKEE